MWGNVGAIAAHVRAHVNVSVGRRTKNGSQNGQTKNLYHIHLFPDLIAIEVPDLRTAHQGVRYLMLFNYRTPRFAL